MSKGLSISDVVNVDIVMSPLAAATRNFGSLLILGSTPNIIDIGERIRLYEGDILTAVAGDFGEDSPEYLAADLFCSQSPQPSVLYIGVYAQVATAGKLKGGALTSQEQLISVFNAVAAGSLDLTIDGTAAPVTGIDLSGAGNLNAVAADVTTALAGKATVVWDASNARFVVTSSTTGSTSAVSFAAADATGTDLGPLLGLAASDGGSLVAGSAIETALAGVAACANASTDWYGVTLAPVTALADSDRLAIAAFIEGASPSRIHGITTQSAAVLDPASTTDIASQLQALKYNRTCIQYSSSSPYAIASLMGRAFTVDFTANLSTITLKFKQEPGIAAETLTETQAAALTAKNCNTFVNYNNSTAIIQQGAMCSGAFFDEIQGLDWLQNDVQTDVYNALYTSTTKVPQTDPGVNQLVTACDSALEDAVTNGLLAPGTWTAPGFGALVQGQQLAKGYYTYAPTVASQSPSDRQARKAPTLQIAAKLAGAVHFANVIINVNR